MIANDRRRDTSRLSSALETLDMRPDGVGAARRAIKGDLTDNENGDPGQGVAVKGIPEAYSPPPISIPSTISHSGIFLRISSAPAASTWVCQR
ncbi:hypothetical protein HAHE_36550 [Haloferula helveola]|uniref:Uncharacterized protein n=1 Tax=Haloferula helveola TaxID=490095 RepID=A0ABN6HB91_9BACT|nr:hypothetical protein HAHE_36550 [Haloferula helveola]